MYYLYENTDSLHAPVEYFLYDSTKKQFPVKPHWHYFMEIMLMQEGQAEIFAGDKKYILSQGDVLVFHPKMVHSVYATDENTPPIYAVVKFDMNRLRLTSNYAPKLRSIFCVAERKEMNNYFEKGSYIADQVAQLFLSCMPEAERKEYGYDLIMNTSLYPLLIQLIREWQKEGLDVNEAYDEDSNYDIYNITEYIDINMYNGIKVSDIAEKCGMSYSYFAKRFLSVYGKSCKEYIDTMRLFKAEELLLFTDFDLNYISQETGFSDCSHLIKSFKNFKGITPKQFRLRHMKHLEEQSFNKVLA